MFRFRVRVSDAALSRWYELQCKAVELLNSLCEDDASARASMNVDVLLLCIDVKQLSGRFFVNPMTV